LSATSRALTIAVTGGVASGKSELTRRFEAQGVPVLDADLVSRELVEPGQLALEQIVERFGASMLDADGRLDRAGLRSVVFADTAARRDLEAILHPRVRVVLRERAQAAIAPYVVLAIPLLVESGHYNWIDRVLLVDVPEAVQLARLMQRDGGTRESARALMLAQASREARLALATDVVINDGPLATLDRAVGRLHQRYLAEAGIR
jgi:dephospho-CoA kinase